jgi:hypothetical protein
MEEDRINTLQPIQDIINKLENSLILIDQLLQTFDENIIEFNPPVEPKGSGSGVGGIERYTDTFFRDFEVDAKNILKEVSKIEGEIKQSESLQEKVLLKERILLERLLLGDVPEKGRLYLVSVGGKEVRINVKNALKELNELMSDKGYLVELLELDKDQLKAEMAKDQLRYNALRYVREKRSK